MQTKQTKGKVSYLNTGDGPVTRALLNALSKRLVSLKQDLTALLDQERPKEQLEARAAECVAMAKEINELVNWMYPPRKPFSAIEAAEFARQMRDECGLTDDAVTWTFEMARKKERGRPAKMRQLYIRAFEIKLSEPTWSWMVLARQLCPCEEQRHDRRCSDNVRRGVVALKKFLRKYDIRIQERGEKT